MALALSQDAFGTPKYGHDDDLFGEMELLGGRLPTPSFEELLKDNDISAQPTEVVAPVENKPVRKFIAGLVLPDPTKKFNGPSTQHSPQQASQEKMASEQPEVSKGPETPEKQEASPKKRSNAKVRQAAFFCPFASECGGEGYTAAEALRGHMLRVHNIVRPEDDYTVCGICGRLSTDKLPHVNRQCLAGAYNSCMTRGIKEEDKKYWMITPAENLDAWTTEELRAAFGPGKSHEKSRKGKRGIEQVDPSDNGVHTAPTRSTGPPSKRRKAEKQPAHQGDSGDLDRQVAKFMVWLETNNVMHGYPKL